MRTILITLGVMNVLFALFHIGFWKIFDWKHDLARLQPINRAIMQTLNLVLIYLFLGFAALSIVLAGADSLGGLERALCAFVGGVFLLRAALQLPLFGTRHLAAGTAIIGVCGLIGVGYVWVAI